MVALALEFHAHVAWLVLVPAVTSKTIGKMVKRLKTHAQKDTLKFTALWRLIAQNLATPT